MARRTIRTKKNREKLLEEFSKTPNICAAVDKVGIGRQSFYEWIAADEDFKKAVEETRMGPGADNLEAVAIDHALNGTPKPVIFQGAIQYQMKPRLKNGKAEFVKDELGNPHMLMDYVLDEKGQPIPLTIVEFDHALLTRMLDRLRPRPLAGQLGEALLNIGEELEAARQRAGIKAS
jgi:hypothetical protein